MITKITPININNLKYMNNNYSNTQQSIPSFGCNNLNVADKFVRERVSLKEGLSQISDMIEKGKHIALLDKTDPYSNFHNLSLSIAQNKNNNKLTLKLNYINHNGTGSFPLYTDKKDKFAENLKKEKTITLIEDTIRDKSLRYED